MQMESDNKAISDWTRVKMGIGGRYETYGCCVSLHDETFG